MAQRRVLRIGVLRDGKMVEDRLPSSSVLIEGGHTLLERHGTHWVLCVDTSMRGRVSTGTVQRPLGDLRADPAATITDGIVRLQLTEADRGKIVAGHTTVLYQFVQAPSAAAAARAPDFRPRLIDDDDPVFLGLLATWSAMAAMLLVWVWGTAPAPFTLEDLPIRIVRLTPRAITTPDPVEEALVDPALEPEVEVEVLRDEQIDPVADADVPAPRQLDPALQRARDAQRALDSVQDNPMLVKFLGTTGESPTIAQQLWTAEEQGLGDLDNLLDEHDGIVTTDPGPRPGHPGGEGEADITVREVGGGHAGGIDAPTVDVEVVQADHEARITGTGSESGVRAVVSRYAGQLQYCFESRIKVLPELTGRIEMSWGVEDGAVLGTPYVVLNTTGDAALAECVTRKIRRWEFEADVSGDVTYPFVFRKK